jgi:hypothetical protein
MTSAILDKIDRTLMHAEMRVLAHHRKNTPKKKQKGGFWGFVDDVKGGVEKGIKEVYSTGKKAVQWGGKKVDKILEDSENLAVKFANDGESLFRSTTSALPNLTYLAIGVVALLIFNAEGVGRGIQSAGTGIHEARGAF